jgi:hypothetical protein
MVCAILQQQLHDARMTFSSRPNEDGHTCPSALSRVGRHSCLDRTAREVGEAIDAAYDD